MPSYDPIRTRSLTRYRRRFDFALRLESPERLSVTDAYRMDDAVEIAHVDRIGPDRRRRLIDETLRRVRPSQLSRGKVHRNEFAIADSDIDDAIRDRGRDRMASLVS